MNNTMEETKYTMLDIQKDIYLSCFNRSLMSKKREVYYRIKEIYSLIQYRS